MTQHILTLSSYLTSPIEGLLDSLKELRKSWEAHQAVRQTEKELRSLSDRELNDIGIARGDIYSIARGDTTMSRVNAEENSNLKGWV